MKLGDVIIMRNRLIMLLVIVCSVTKFSINIYNRN